jgi:hypothetical protein
VLRYTGTCPLSALCSTLFAQVNRYLPSVRTVQHFACSGSKVLAHCQHCAATCLLTYKGTRPLLPLCSTLLLRYTGTCPLSALCSTLLVKVHRYLPTVSTVQHIACSGTQGLAHCQHCAAQCLRRYTWTSQMSAMCSSLFLAQVHMYLPTVSTVQQLSCLVKYTGT